MNWSNCDSNNIRKNGQRRGKHNYQCKNCGRKFIESYSPRGYSREVMEACLYINRNGFRAIDKMNKVNHNKVIRRVKKQNVFKVDGKLQNHFFKTLFHTAIAPFFRNFGLINIKNQPKH